MEGTEEWKKEEERLVEALSTGAKGEEGTKLVRISCWCSTCSRVFFYALPHLASYLVLIRGRYGRVIDLSGLDPLQGRI